MRLCFESHEKFETEFSKPICLTGPPGVGKSALVKAIQRLYKPEQCIDIGEGYGKFPLVGTWTITVKNISTINAALRQKLPIGLVMGKRASTHDLTYKCIEVAYRHGVALLMLDELQTALNTGQKANLIPDTVMALGHLGLPFMYVANYNLCHRLNEKMPRHVRHRILSWPFVMLPSPPDSTDWLQYLREIARILGSSLAVDLEDKRHLIFQYTGGIKRFVVQLFTRAYAVAFSQGRLVVNMRDIETYFDSTANSPNRTEIETALSAFAGKHTRSKEYDCPFELPKITAAAYVEVQKRSQAEAINQKLQMASLSRTEQIALKKDARKQVPIALTSPVPKMPQRARMKKGDALAALVAAEQQSQQLSNGSHGK